MLNIVKGMRVVLNSKAHSELVGLSATVVSFDGKIAGLKMDKMLYLHDCNGDTEQGYGWYEAQENVDEECTSLICRLMPRDKELIRCIRSEAIFDVGSNTYSKRENGAFTFFEGAKGKVIVIKSGIPVPVLLSCNNEDDRKLINHVLDTYKVSVGKALTLVDEKYVMVAFTTKESDECEKKFLKPASKKELEKELNKSDTIQVTSEAELYASLGITPTPTTGE